MYSLEKHSGPYGSTWLKPAMLADSRDLIADHADVTASLVSIKKITRPLEYHTNALVFLVFNTDELLTTCKSLAKVQHCDLAIF